MGKKADKNLWEPETSFPGGKYLNTEQQPAGPCYSFSHATWKGLNLMKA